MPIKQLSGAKTRLAADGQVRRELALAMALDTLAALRAAQLVASLWVVTGDSVVRTAVKNLGTILVEEPTTTEVDPLNAALRCGLHQISAVAADGPVAIVASDLPALRNAELDRLLEVAGRHERAVVADHSGSGTTLMTGLHASSLDPQFGRQSFARHLTAGAVPLDAEATLRQDVDTPDDLVAALRLGVGPLTRAVAQRQQSL